MVFPLTKKKLCKTSTHVFVTRKTVEEKNTLFRRRNKLKMEITWRFRGKNRVQTNALHTSKTMTTSYTTCWQIIVFFVKLLLKYLLSIYLNLFLNTHILFLLKHYKTSLIQNVMHLHSQEQTESRRISTNIIYYLWQMHFQKLVTVFR